CCFQILCLHVFCFSEGSSIGTQ
ncbi:hypothetical protein CARUB_v10011359mg, partial [Capsella rubella]